MNKEFTYEVKAISRDRAGKARVFVWGAPEPDDSNLPAPKERGVDPENDKAYDKHNRAVVRIQKAHLVAAMELGLLPSTEELRFSRKAGCSCPCSPGFIANIREGYDYHITVKTVEVTEEAPKKLVSKKLAAIKG